MNRRLVGFAALAGCAALSALLVTAAGAASAASQAPRSMTFYSLATAEQFVNNADDRQRGKGNNPFGNFHDSTATTREKGNGPFPGDEALFKFKVYKAGDLKQAAGTATYTCEYNFQKNAFCNATYQLGDGILIGEGPLDFNAPSYSIAITGGTGKYRGARGDLESSPGPKHSQRLSVQLID